MKKLLLLSLTLFVSLTAGAFSVFTYPVPSSAAEIQVGTEIDETNHIVGQLSFIDAEEGQTVYFAFEPYLGYKFSGIRYQNISADDVSQISERIFSFTMPKSNVSIFIDFVLIPVTYNDVNINETTFPDTNFRNWLLAQSYGNDNVITGDEIASVTKITARTCGIEDLTGLEHFPALVELDVSNDDGTAEDSWNRITAIDLSANTRLRTLYCDNNLLTSLDLSNCTDFKNLSCNNNKLASLNVTGNPRLSILSCQRNMLTALDVSQNLLIDQLFCEYNQLSSIDVTNHNKMIIFNCNDNQLTSLDLSGCKQLFQLYFYNNKINGQAMQNLVNSLETPPNGGYMVVLDLDSDIEQNAITSDQATVARQKNWSVEALSDGDFIPYGEGEATHESVDLGLTSGTLWATCNVGANLPKEAGLYFAWGDINGHGNDVSDGYLFNWENYVWGEVKDDNTFFTKYCSDSSRGKDGFTDGKINLDPEDDAAYVLWGPEWSMPTKEQQDELKSECEWIRIDDDDFHGYEVKGPNGNSILLPETSWRIDDMLLEGGAYWSRTTNPDDVGGAYYIGFDNWGDYIYASRSCGQCIRPVTKKTLQQDEDGYYLIGSVSDWDEFAAIVAETPNANAKMVNDISTVSTMIGTSSAPYKGTFDGQAHRLTINISGSDGFMAPFHYVDGGNFYNLYVDGTLTSSGIHNSGLIGWASNVINIENCVVAVDIQMEGDYAGGFVGNGGSRSYGHASKVVMKNCLFIGSLVGNGSTRNYAAGFWGWGKSTPAFINCLENGTFSNVSNFAPFLFEGTDGENTTSSENSYYYNGNMSTTWSINANDISVENLVERLGSAWGLDKTTGAPMLKIFMEFETGDVNCDGSVNAADVTALYSFILNGNKTYEATSDVNGDHSINAADVTAVYKIILGN